VGLRGLDPHFGGAGGIPAAANTPIPTRLRPVAAHQASPNAPCRASVNPPSPCPGPPAAFNAHSWLGGSGLVQHVFRSPARLPLPAATPRASCAAPLSEKRSSFEKRSSLCKPRTTSSTMAAAHNRESSLGNYLQFTPSAWVSHDVNLKTFPYIVFNLSYKDLMVNHDLPVVPR